ncbi:unnamed protein product [Prunus armeniaca]
MSYTESDYSRSPRAFDGDTASESTTEGLDSADFEETEREVPEVSTDSGSTSSVVEVGADGAWSSTSGRRLGEAEEDVTVADLGEGVLTVVTGRQRIPMAKPKDLVFGLDHLEPNIMTEAEVAKIRALYNIPESVKMQIPGPLESLSNPTREVVFFTDVFKHGLRLPLRYSVQKVLVAIDYAPGQFNPNFWIAGEGESSYEQFAHLYSVTRAKSADQRGWVQSNCLAAGQRGNFVVGVPSSQKTWRRHRVLVSGA